MRPRQLELLDLCAPFRLGMTKCLQKGTGGAATGLLPRRMADMD